MFNHGGSDLGLCPLTPRALHKGTCIQSFHDYVFLNTNTMSADTISAVPHWADSPSEPLQFPWA